jgi:hypothetical protein
MSARRRLLRGLTRLAWENDPVFAGDRKYFEGFPHRRHRVRLTSRAEIETLRLLHGREWLSPLEHGDLVTVVRQVLPGVRLRAFVGTTNSDDLDSLSEREAAILFDLGAPPGRLVVVLDGVSTTKWEIEANLRAAFGGRHGGRT